MEIFHRVHPCILHLLQTAESCLFLNIWTPLAAAPNTSYPVMVYLHGGNFVHMSVSSAIFRGDDFVGKGEVIYVAVEYRLGKNGLSLIFRR